MEKIFPDAPVAEMERTQSPDFSADDMMETQVPASWLDEAHEESRELRKELKRSEKELKYLEKRCNEKREKSERQAQLVQQLTQERAHLAQELAQQRASCENMAQSLAAADVRLRAMEESNSWRMFAIIRCFFDAIKRCVGKFVMRLWRARIGMKEAAPAPNMPQKELQKERQKKGKEEPMAWPPTLKEHVSPDEACTVSVNGRRLLIYAFYDADGIVDEYVLYFLQSMTPWAEKILVVSNGALCPEGEQALRKLGCEVLCRKNTGYDAWAFKAGLEHIGFDALSAYDEAVFANDSLFGPVSDLKDLFEPMSAKKVDFWGIFTRPEIQADPFGCTPYGYVPERIQPPFYTIRKRLLTSQTFRQFWTELPELPDTNRRAGLYESVMTRFFSDAGYCWTCAMYAWDYKSVTDDPLITMPVESIRDWGSPFILRKAFYADYDYLTAVTGQQSAVCLMQYLQESKVYDVDLVWHNLIRTCHMSNLDENMNLSFIFSPDMPVTGKPSLRSAMFIHIYDASMAEELAQYAANLPPETDILISTVSEDRRQRIETVFSRLPNRLEIRVLPNRGRDVSALLTSFCDVVGNYDVACVTHDKKVPYLKPQTLGESFKYAGYENILASRSFVEQVLCTFEKEKYLGLLCAPDPKFGYFFPRIGMLEWGPNFANTKALAEELGLKVPMDERHPPAAPIGSSFWFRTKALAPLFARKWSYSDFPEEPFDAKDGSILQAIERIYPYAAQQAGYYSALLMTTDFASIDIGNMSYYTRGYAEVCYDTQIMWPFTLANVCVYCRKLLREQGQEKQSSVPLREPSASSRREEPPTFKSSFVQNLWGLLSDWEKL